MLACVCRDIKDHCYTGQTGHRSPSQRTSSLSVSRRASQEQCATTRVDTDSVAAGAMPRDPQPFGPPRQSSDDPRIDAHRSYSERCASTVERALYRTESASPPSTERRRLAVAVSGDRRGRTQVPDRHYFVRRVADVHHATCTSMLSCESVPRSPRATNSPELFATTDSFSIRQLVPPWLPSLQDTRCCGYSLIAVRVVGRPRAFRWPYIIFWVMDPLTPHKRSHRRSFWRSATHLQPHHGSPTRVN